MITAMYSNEELKLFVNGINTDSKSEDISNYIGNNLWISHHYNACGWRALKGKTDEFSVWSKSLTETEILQLYANYHGPDTLSAQEGDQQITLRWSSERIGSIEKYYIYRDSLLHDSVEVTTVNDTVYTDQNFSNYQTYSYFIRSVDTLGNLSQPSDTIEVFPCEIIADVDENEYTTTKIGEQVWMAENLATTKYNDGTTIPNVTSDSQWADLSAPAYCWYDNDEASYKDTYGALYNWYAVETGKLCPDGWHVPSDEEWKELEMFLGMSQEDADTTGWRGTDEGDKLKVESGWNSDGNGTDDYGFTALPGGYRNGGSGYFNDEGSYGYWWSSAEYSTSGAWRRSLSYSRSNVRRYLDYRQSGFSVRCVRD